MDEKLAATDWAAARGRKWRDQLEGMEAMLAPVDAPLIEALHLDALHLDAPYRVADIACGGGGTTLKILHRAPAGSVVHGFDISPDLVELARTRSDNDSIAFNVADMGTAPAPGAPYDRLVSRFGIMFFDDPEAAFSNLSSWLGNSGRFAFAVWGPAPDNPWMSIIRESIGTVINVPPPDLEAPGPFRYGGGEKLLGLLEAAGLGSLRIQDWRGALPLGGGLPAAEAAHFALESFSVGDLLAEADEAALHKVRRLMTARFAEHEQDGAVQVGARVHVVTGASADGVVNAP